jgi:choline dehydrogenase
MTFIRGHRLDFENWMRAGNVSWGYEDVLPVFRRIEDNSRGASQYRGAGGPLRVSDCLDPHAAHEAFLTAARSLGYQADPSWELALRSQKVAPGTIRRTSGLAAATASPTPFCCRS